MVRMLVRHQVEDYAAWRQAYDDFDATRTSMGATGAAVYQALDDPNDVTVWHDFATAEAAQAFAGSAELRDTMANAGVVGEPTIWFVREA